jgi:hypothetical protein
MRNRLCEIYAMRMQNIDQGILNVELSSRVFENNQRAGGSTSTFKIPKGYLKSTVQFWHFISTFKPLPSPTTAVNLAGPVLSLPHIVPR